MNPSATSSSSSHRREATTISLADALRGIDARQALEAGLESGVNEGPMTPEELDRLLPTYEVEALIGRGGMGLVYRGRDPRLDRRVAIKVLSTRLSGVEEFISRFSREAKALARLDHPNIIRIFDFGTVGDSAYFVMEYVEGVDLAAVLREAAGAGRYLESSAALQTIGQVCDALQYAHAQGIVHRDIKPANILIARNGQVKVADFGLARPVEPEAGLTMSGAVMGTPDYMAPEQRRGKTVDHRADLYALGVMLYEMLTGELPQGAFLPASQRCGSEIRLDEIVNKALQTDPAARYQQAADFKSDVTSVKAPSEPVSMPKAVTSPPRMSRAVLLSLVGLFSLIALTVAGWMLWKNDSVSAMQEIVLTSRKMQKEGYIMNTPVFIDGGPSNGTELEQKEGVDYVAMVAGPDDIEYMGLEIVDRNGNVLEKSKIGSLRVATVRWTAVSAFPVSLKATARRPDGGAPEQLVQVHGFYYPPHLEQKFNPPEDSFIKDSTDEIESSQASPGKKSSMPWKTNFSVWPRMSAASRQILSINSSLWTTCSAGA